MAKTQDSTHGDEGAAPEPDPDLLAAVVLHVLVSEGREGLSTEAIALACERDPRDEQERAEVERALEILVRDDLAVRGGPGAGAPEPGAAGEPKAAGSSALFAPTRAAVRAAELSF